LDTVEREALKFVPAIQAKQGASKHQIKEDQREGGFAFGSYNYDIAEKRNIDNRAKAASDIPKSTSMHKNSGRTSRREHNQTQ